MTKIDVLIGGQFGSEGKGLVASLLAKDKKYDNLISVNSAQAGHTGYCVEKDEFVVTRQLPASCLNNSALIYIGPGAILNLHVLEDEIKMLESLDIKILGRLSISPEATIISPSHIQEEKNGLMKEKIGSTCEGVGAALADRIQRKTGVFKNFYNRFLEMNGWSMSDIYMTNVPVRGNIFLEGSQGYGLSCYSGYYPFCTSRDTTTAAFLSYARSSPLDVNDVFGVYRTYPIRVGGSSGPLLNELNWESLSVGSGYENLCEKTTVTGRIRRIAEWDAALAAQSAIVNGVTKPILTFVNYLNKKFEEIQEVSEQTKVMLDEYEEFFKQVEASVGKLYAISTNAKNLIIEGVNKWRG